eukprot:c6657_g1_i1 orf=214-483(-)
MPPSAIELLIHNIPVHFDQWNDHPRGCVEMEMSYFLLRRRHSPKLSPIPWREFCNKDEKKIVFKLSGHMKNHYKNYSPPPSPIVPHSSH